MVVMRSPLLLAALVLSGLPSSARAFPELGLHAPAPYCSGDYADDLSALSKQVKEFERQPKHPSSSFCLRNTAVYECIAYGSEGTIHRSRRKSVAHGTGFAYRQQGADTFLVTNQHVAEWPAVTDEDHRVDDIPSGCKKVSDTLKIVDNEADSYDRDDVPLSRVVADLQLDIAVVKAKSPLPVMPWKVGRSATLRERNVVDVQGFPLGAFQATNVGKVVSAYHHDDERDWDHDDFIIDALLSPGNSGSPVLAVSCKTGEFELVGVYHAGYIHGSALNVVIGIDQIRDLMFQLKKSAKPKIDEASNFGEPERSRLNDAARLMVEPFFPFGSLTAVVRPRPDGALMFTLFSKEFPFKSHPLLAIEDLVPDNQNEFGELGRIWFGSAQGLKPYVKADFDADTQATLNHTLDALRHDSLNAFTYRTASLDAQSSRDRFEQVSKLERSLKRSIESRRDLVANLVDISDKWAPHTKDSAVSFANVFAVELENPAFPSNLRKPTAKPLPEK